MTDKASEKVKEHLEKRGYESKDLNDTTWETKNDRNQQRRIDADGEWIYENGRWVRIG